MAQTIIGHVEPFQPGTDDWEQYEERLQQYFEANGLDGDKKRAVFLTVMGAQTYSLLSSLVAPAKPATRTYDELVATLKDHLKPKPLVIAERFKFHRRNQGETETVAEYMAELRKLASKCQFGTYLNEALRDRLVCGLRSGAVQKKLLVIEALTIQKAYETAHGMELAARQADELQATSKVTAEVQYVRKPPGVPVNHKRSARLRQDNQHQPTDQHQPTKTCYRCGRPGHPPERCYYRTQTCRECKRYGHIAKMCRDRRIHQVGEEEELSEGENTEDLPLLNIQVVKRGSYKAGIGVDLSVDGKALKMELDTGASVSIVSKKTWQEVLGSPLLTPSMLRLKTYTGEELEILGERLVKVQYGEQVARVPLIVVAGQGPSLFGRSWLEKVRLDWATIGRVGGSAVDEMLHEFAELFQPELGTIKGVQAQLEVQDDATPKFFRPRSVPYALRGAIEQDLERLEQLGIIEKVRYSDWAAPIVPVPKGDGGIRLCGDYKVTVNPVLKVDKYPLPTPEDLFATLAGGESFTKLDLSQAYQQIELTPESRRYVTVNTHKGLYRYTRLPFGIASAPSLFQQIMEKILQGIPHVVVYIDDILITGKDEKEHLHILRQVLERLREYGIRLKREKCRLMRPSVDYLGYRIDKHGLHTMPDKVAAISEAPSPQNVKELRAFLGLVNYYGKFLRDLSTINQPLNRLLGQGVPWCWNKACAQAFEQLKVKLASAEVLAHYDPEQPVKLDCDASAYGIGAVLSHVYSDGSERPIAYASRTLSSPERNYAQIEKEGLALIWGVRKFHKYLYGRPFTLVTDHKPLLAILGSHKGLPSLAAARLQRWAVFLLGYTYVLKFRGTNQHCNADGFSRLPRTKPQEVADKFEAATTAFNIHQIKTLPVTPKELAAATITDPELSQVMRYCQNGWPLNVPATLQPYRQKQEEIGIEANCLFRGTQVIVPGKLRPQVLAELHTGHPGIVRMKGLARSRIWWPGLAKQVEETVQGCGACQSHQNTPAPAPLHPWPWPKSPWERIHVDFAGPVKGVMYFVIVDSHSKWIEVEPMNSTTTEKTMDVLRSLFARYGLPKELVSDNGPQFTAAAFTEFMSTNGIRHSKSAPYHPATNGAAERVVQTLKNALRAGKDDTSSINQRLAQFLLAYRTTPHSTTGVPPTDLFLKRSLRTRLDVMRPSLEDKVVAKQQDQKKYHDQHARERTFSVNQEVMVRNWREGPKWVRGTVQRKLGALSYEVEVGSQVWRRHANQLLCYRGPPGNRDTGIAEGAELEPQPSPIMHENPDLEMLENGTQTPVIDSPAPLVEPVPEASGAMETRGTLSTPPSPRLATPTTPPAAPQTKTYPHRNRVARGHFDPSFL